MSDSYNSQLEVQQTNLTIENLNELNMQSNELTQNNKYKCKHDLVRTAYNELKKIKLAQPVTQN